MSLSTLKFCRAIAYFIATAYASMAFSHSLHKEHHRIHIRWHRTPSTDTVVSVNLAGEGFRSQSGEIFIDGAPFISGGHILNAQVDIHGVSDPTPFLAFRQGAQSFVYPIANGTYDLTFMFIDPASQQVGERVFDIQAQGHDVIKGLDVYKERDGTPNAALSRTVSDIPVKHGSLKIDLVPRKGEPILSALRISQRALQRRLKWKLIWHDEFEKGVQPDRALWDFDVWPAHTVNDESQAYTARPDNVRIGNGKLIIEARHEDYDNAHFTSGRIFSKGIGKMLYGRIEVRAKIPSVPGSWPAIWMLPVDPYRYATNCKAPEPWQGSGTCNAWPNSGEIDILEHVGNDPNIVHGTVHSLAYYWVNRQQRKGSIEVQTIASRFHTYAMEWSPRQIKMFVDDVPYFQYDKEVNADWRSWPFDGPFHLVINQAVGGSWGASNGGIDTSQYPQKMEIDYVRVFSLAKP